LKAPSSFSVNVAENGRLVLPVQLRAKLGLSRGGRLTIREDGERYVIETFAERVRRAQDELAQVVGADRNLADELIAERRAAARREEEAGPA
jgi:AbrB family looped-hinge helix DNA binding protein